MTWNHTHLFSFWMKLLSSWRASQDGIVKLGSKCWNAHFQRWARMQRWIALCTCLLWGVGCSGDLVFFMETLKWSKLAWFNAWLWFNCWLWPESVRLFKLLNPNCWFRYLVWDWICKDRFYGRCTISMVMWGTRGLKPFIQVATSLYHSYYM